MLWPPDAWNPWISYGISQVLFWDIPYHCIGHPMGHQQGYHTSRHSFTVKIHYAPSPSLASLRRFAVAAPHFLDSTSLFRLISSASSTVHFTFSILPQPYVHLKQLASCPAVSPGICCCLTQILAPHAIWNGWMCVASQVAWYERHLSLHVLYWTDIACWHCLSDRSYSIGTSFSPCIT